MMGTESISEISVSFYQSTQCYSPHIRSRKNQNSHRVLIHLALVCIRGYHEDKPKRAENGKYVLLYLILLIWDRTLNEKTAVNTDVNIIARHLAAVAAEVRRPWRLRRSCLSSGMFGLITTEELYYSASN